MKAIIFLFLSHILASYGRKGSFSGDGVIITQLLPSMKVKIFKNKINFFPSTHWNFAKIKSFWDIVTACQQWMIRLALSHKIICNGSASIYSFREYIIDIPAIEKRPPIRRDSVCCYTLNFIVDVTGVIWCKM